jgi:protoheme IX farnesyltransferase
MSMSDIHADISETTSSAQGGQGTVGDYWALLKPRVMSLVIFTALAGLVAAPADIHPWLALVALIAIAVGAGASGALNMWYDADIDAVMARTANRPVPRGAILPGEALGFGIALAVGSVLVLGLLVNIVAGALLAFTIFFYAVIYTMWLKRSTPQNIVIGGAAGAFPPMIGWAAATSSVTLASIALFLIIFMWTPPHFWALALFRENDYARANVPMLPNVAGAAETRKQILLYSLILVPTTFLPSLLGTTGLLYTIVTALLGVAFLWHAVDVYRLREGEAARRACRRLFGFSILYLFVIFALIIAERILGIAAFAPVVG